MASSIATAVWRAAKPFACETTAFDKGGPHQSQPSTFPYDTHQAFLIVVRVDAEYGLTMAPFARVRLFILEKRDAAYPLGRMARPDDIASLVALLVVDGASYLTAITIFIDGGIMHGSPAL